MISELLARLIEVLFPPRNTEALLRETPLAQYEQLVRPTAIAGVEALLPYSDPRVRALVWELKYKHSDRAATIAGKLLSEHLLAVLAEEMAHRALLVPIPLHTKRLRERGYNQSERIALETLPFLHEHVRLMPNALSRTRNTPRQTTLGRAERMRNITGAFEADTKLVTDATIILLDDVVTTGATLSEAKTTLLRAGARQVIPVALSYAAASTR